MDTLDSLSHEIEEQGWTWALESGMYVVENTTLRRRVLSWVARVNSEHREAQYTGDTPAQALKGAYHMMIQGEKV